MCEWLGIVTWLSMAEMGNWSLKQCDTTWQETGGTSGSFPWSSSAEPIANLSRHSSCPAGSWMSWACCRNSAESPVPLEVQDTPSTLTAALQNLRLNHCFCVFVSQNGAGMLQVVVGIAALTLWSMPSALAGLETWVPPADPRDCNVSPHVLWPFTPPMDSKGSPCFLLISVLRFCLGNCPGFEMPKFVCLWWTFMGTKIRDVSVLLSPAEQDHCQKKPQLVPYFTFYFFSFFFFLLHFFFFLGNS